MGAKFVVFAIPAQRQQNRHEFNGGPSENSRTRWKIWAENNGIAFVDLLKEFRREPEKAKSAFFPKDGHYNEIGHSVTARALCREIEGFFGGARRLR